MQSEPTPAHDHSHVDLERILALAEHFEQAIGRPVVAYHDRRRKGVHVDVHVVPPIPAHPYFTLFTSGMSARPMSGVPRCSCCDRAERAELMMVLPATWKLPLDCARRGPVSKRARHRTWPITLMRDLAHYVHECRTWFGWSHTVPNGNPAEPFDADTRFAGVIMLPPVLGPGTLRERVRGPGGERIQLMALLPLYPEEMALKLREGPGALIDRLDAQGVTELVDDARRSVAAPSPRALPV